MTQSLSLGRRTQRTASVCVALLMVATLLVGRLAWAGAPSTPGQPAASLRRCHGLPSGSAPGITSTSSEGGGFDH